MKTKEIIFKTAFWNGVTYALKATSLVVKMLRLVDGYKKPVIGYIYDASDRFI